MPKTWKVSKAGILHTRKKNYLNSTLVGTFSISNDRIPTQTSLDSKSRVLTIIPWYHHNSNQLKENKRSWKIYPVSWEEWDKPDQVRIRSLPSSCVPSLNAFFLLPTPTFCSPQLYLFVLFPHFFSIEDLIPPSSGRHAHGLQLTSCSQILCQPHQRRDRIFISQSHYVKFQ